MGSAFRLPLRRLAGTGRAGQEGVGVSPGGAVCGSSRKERKQVNILSTIKNLAFSAALLPGELPPSRGGSPPLPYSRGGGTCPFLSHSPAREGTPNASSNSPHILCVCVGGGHHFKPLWALLAGDDGSQSPAIWTGPKTQERQKECPSCSPMGLRRGEGTALGTMGTVVQST